ncbi:MAG: hypothetical protein V4508_12480 [Pseudomonadota bacterium]
MPDQLRCIHAACARALPRPVNFCPYCGTGQHAGVNKPAHAMAPPPLVVPRAPAPEAVAPAPAAAKAAPLPPLPPAPPPAPAAAAPPRRAPVRLRYWLLALGLLWLIWITARPGGKVEARIEHAIALSGDCNFGQAQAELISLRSSRATSEQLLRLQKAINEAVPACEKQRARAKAWGETVAAVEAALAAQGYDKARARLAAFVRRWNEDGAARALGARIEAGRARADPSARNLIDEAERDIAQGNYKGALDKMDTCAAMLEVGNQACAAVKARAERLLRQR